MKELIKIEKQTIGEDEINAVDARGLHEFLEVKSNFRDWIKNRIRDYDFQENQDFIKGDMKLSSSKTGQTTTEYTISIDMAKELSMVERNHKGKEARKYFIECEKKLKPQTELEMLLATVQKAVEHERKIKDLEVQQKETTAQISALLDGENYFTIIGYCNIIERKMDSRTAASFGKKAAALSRSKEIQMGRASHPLFGEVNSYHRSILIEVLGE